MSMLDFFTGGKSKAAIDALNRAESYFNGLKTPTVQELTLPELQKYVEAGLMTPAEAQAYLQERNAYSDMDVDQTGTQAQVSALNRLSQVANAGDMGTLTDQASMDQAEQNMNRAVGGQRGAIEQAMAAKGTPYALIQAALANQTVGQEGQQAHMDAVNAQSAAYEHALNALSQSGQLGGQLQGQQNQQANTVAQAQNAMQQFNAANQTNMANANAGRAQEANAMNTANKQQVSNNNTGLSNTRTQYNANLPQQVFNNQLNKAMGQSGAATNIGNMQQNQGQQNAGIMSGLINTATSFIPKPAEKTPKAAHGGIVSPYGKPPLIGAPRGAHGGVIDSSGRPCYDEGGIIPGEASISGDSLSNDNMPINVSPGEAILSRETVAHNPEVVGSLLDNNDSGSQVDFQDVATLLKALRSIRMGTA